MLKLRQKVYLEYSYKSKGAKLTSAIVLWDWLLFFASPCIFTMKHCLQASFWSLALRWYWLFWCLDSKWHWLLLPTIGALEYKYIHEGRYELYLTFTYLSTSPLVEETYSIRLSQWWMPGWCTLSNQFSVLFMQEFGFVYHSSTIHGIFFDHASFFSIQFLCA